MNKIIFLVLVCSLTAHTQQRILVSPNGDARAITGRESISDIVRADAAKMLNATCSNKGTFGYSTDLYPGANVQFEAFHKDIVAMWYLAPASGTIDTVFVYNLDVGTQDSTVTVRLPGDANVSIDRRRSREGGAAAPHAAHHPHPHPHQKQHEQQQHQPRLRNPSDPQGSDPQTPG